MSLFDNANIQKLLDRKYGILQQDANAGTTTASAGMLNAKTNAAQLPGQVAEMKARARLYGVQADQLPMDSQSNRLAAQAQYGTAGQLGAKLLAEQIGPEAMAMLVDSGFQKRLAEQTTLSPFNQPMALPDPYASSRIMGAKSVPVGGMSTTTRRSLGMLE